MAPTESSILTNFLLSPAPLETAVSKERFAAYFGKYSSHEDVQLLYRVLSQQIQEGMEEVKANISAEAQQGVKQQRQVVKARRKEHQTIIDAFELQDIQMTMELRDGEPAKLALSETHGESSIMEPLMAACDDLEHQIFALEQETSQALDDIKQIVGSLSDLRYGRLPQIAGGNETIAEETTNAIRQLEQVCQQGQRS